MLHLGTKQRTWGKKAQKEKQTHSCSRYFDLNSKLQAAQKLSQQNLWLSVQSYTQVQQLAFE